MSYFTAVASSRLKLRRPLRGLFRSSSISIFHQLLIPFVSFVDARFQHLKLGQAILDVAFGLSQSEPVIILSDARVCGEMSQNQLSMTKK